MASFPLCIGVSATPRMLPFPLPPLPSTGAGAIFTQSGLISIRGGTAASKCEKLGKIKKDFKTFDILGFLKYLFKKI